MLIVMSQRKTIRWTEKLDDAYYQSKGRPGELAVLAHLEAMGCQRIVDYESNQEIQQAGIDFSYRDEWGQTITLQVKENYKIDTPVVEGAPTPAYFFVEVDRNSSTKHISCVHATYMVHVNVEHMRFVLYSTKQMIDAVEKWESGDIDLQRCQSRNVQLVCIPVRKFDWFVHGNLLTSAEG